MIPESAGATPVGIFMLADEYLEAAEHSAKYAKGGTNGPARLLAYHACELFLKTYLRSHGEKVVTLRDYGHDLSTMLDAALKYGLSPSEMITNHIAVATRRKDYVRVRYLVVDGEFGLRIEKVLHLATALRECVRLALDFNEYGMPNGDLWAAPEPDDYLAAAGRPKQPD